MRCFSLLLLFLSVTRSTATVKKAEIFNTLAKQQRYLQGAQDVEAAVEETEIDHRELDPPPLGSANGDFSVLFESLTTPLVDWQWELAERAFAGDIFGVLKDSMLTNKAHVEEMKETWSKPDILRFLMDNTPFFKVIKPLRMLMDKEEITPQDGLNAVGIFKDAMIKVLDTIESVRSPEGMAKYMFDYSKLQDERWVIMLARMQRGDKTVQVEIQQYVVDRELGNLINLDAMGFNGEEPEYIKMVRRTVKNQEPGLWEAVLKEDQLARKYMEEPTAVIKEIQDLTSEYARNIEGMANL
ncbi:Hypothetical protein NocV09_09600060 [Nannochloropsis oceanica]